MSLVDRLTGRKQPAPKPSTPQSADAIETPEVSTNGQESPAPAQLQQATSTFSRFTEGPEALSAVDQLKVDIHHRLISRLDLEALEAINDE